MCWGKTDLKNDRTRAWVLAALVCALMAPSVSWAAVIAISNDTGLAFGTFVAGAGTDNSVIIPAGGGARDKSGTVVLVPSGAGARAQFTVTGDANAGYTIALPVDDAVTLTSGNNNMKVKTFISSPATSGTLSSATPGVQTLYVGATLSVGSNQPSGSYSGTFTVTVHYN